MLLSNLLTLCVAGAAVALPTNTEPQNASRCVIPRVRRAWHKLSLLERKAYLNAEVCLMKKPATLGIRGARTKFDEFQAAHVLQAEIAHYVGQFLPFHRLFVFAHEQALRNECGYLGTQPYWAEELDAGNFSNSIIFDPVFGFGGNGTGADQCIPDGPFAFYNNSLGPSYEINSHCIERSFSDLASQNAKLANVQECLNKTTFLDHWPCVEQKPHAAGHLGTGGEMLNAVSSPGDPLFFLHHTWLDRIWAQWQAKDPATRFYEIGGNNTGNLTDALLHLPPGVMFPGDSGPPPGLSGFPNLTRPNDVPAPQVYGDPGNTTTLNHLLYLYGLTQNRTIAEVMNTRGVLCYEYD